jgi:hypothetical protein
MVKDLNKIWSWLSSTQQAAFQKANPTFKTDMLATPKKEMNVSTGKYQKITASATPNPVGGEPTLEWSSSPVIKTDSNFNIPKFSDIYWDVSKVSKAWQAKEWLGTSQWDFITDLSKIDTSKVDLWSFKYGKSAEDQERATGDYLAPRNDILAAYYLKWGKTDAQFIYQDLIQNPSFMTSTGWEQDRLNTARAIAERIGKFQEQQQKSWLDLELEDIEADYWRKRDEMLKAWAIEDRYMNFNQVNDEVNNVLKIGGEDRVAKGYKGMPTDKDIQDIAAKSGVTFDRAKRILEGFWYETLQMQPEFEKEAKLGYNRNIEDLTTQKDRYQEDLKIKLDQTRQNIAWQQEDVLRNAQRTADAATIVGSMRWYTNTSWFLDWITQVYSDADRLVWRLETQLWWAESETAKLLDRSLDDYNMNITRQKEDLDYQMRDLNQKMGTSYNTILQQYSGETLLAKLKSLNGEMLNAKIDTIQKYANVVNGLTKAKYDELDQIMKYNEYIQWNQKDTRNQLTSDNWAILQNYSINDLTSMYQNWSISLDQLKMATSAMVTKAQNTLTSAGTPTSQDFDTLNSFLDQWLTVQDAIVKTIQNSNGRLEPITTQKSTTTKKAGAAWDRAIRHNNPLALTTDVAKTFWLKEGVDYTQWDSFVGSGWKMYYTARINWDAVEKFINAFDKTAAASNKSIFYTQSWQQRWSHTAMSDQAWQKLNKSQKEQVIRSMFDQESPYSWEDFQTNAGWKGKQTELNEWINLWYATSSDIRKYKEENKVDDSRIISDYIKSANIKDLQWVTNAINKLSPVYWVSAANSAENKAKKSALLQNILKWLKEWGTESRNAGVNFIVRSMFNAEDKKTVWTALSILYKWTNVKEEDLKSYLEKIWYSRKDRNTIWDVLETKI